MPDKRTTIEDIAREAGLSPSSVSRALNNHPRISKATKKRVFKLAEEMGYIPSFLGRGLAQSRTFLIGLVVPDSRPFFTELTAAVQDAAEEAGYWVLQMRNHDDEHKSATIIDSMLSIGVDGMIYAACRLHDPAVEALIDDGFPIVLANRRLSEDKGDQVIFDDTYGGYLAASHLIRLGYQRIGIIRGSKDLSTAEAQFLGFLQAFDERGIKIPDGMVKVGGYTAEQGYALAKEMMQMFDPPQAILCSDDHAALGVWEYLSEANLRVPQDVGLIGHDDIQISSHPLIQLTTVSGNIEEMGKTAVKLLLRRINDRPETHQKKFLEPHLIIRRSCGYQLRRSNDLK